MSERVMTVPIPAIRHPLHRLAVVRQQQGISRRTVARRLNIDLADSPRTRIRNNRHFAESVVRVAKGPGSAA